MSRALLFLCSTLLCLGLAEAAVRVFGIGPEISPVYRENFQLSENRVLRYELAPHSPDDEVTINSHGMRDREYDFEKPPGTFRIAVVGDSVAFGHTVGQTEAFAKVLESLLNGGAGAPGT